MAGRDGNGNITLPGSKKRDRSIDDALSTMERLATWLQDARAQNAWAQADNPYQIAMLHGLLTHLRGEIGEFLESGGSDVQQTVRNLRALATTDVGGHEQ